MDNDFEKELGRFAPYIVKWAWEIFIGVFLAMTTVFIQAVTTTDWGTVTSFSDFGIWLVAAAPLIGKAAIVPIWNLFLRRVLPAMAHLLDQSPPPTL